MNDYPSLAIALSTHKAPQSGSYLRTNTVISAWSCMILGAGLILGVPGDVFALTIGAPLAFAGSILLLIGLRMQDENSINPEDIATWAPDAIPMPDAGRPMYRVDTSLDPPIRTSILCGPCGHLEWIEGKKPQSWKCPECNISLWVEEDE